MDEVSKTALGVARVRAVESERPDRLFDDPWAAKFCAARPDQVPAGERTPLSLAFAFHAIIRTRFYDDYLLASGCRQVVLLAAGLDSRAFRLDWPAGTSLYELDLPRVLAFKETVLADAEPRCRRTVVPADLRENWAEALQDRGFRPEEPTAWLAEGLLIYLTPEDADRLLSTVTALSAEGSRIAFERGDRSYQDQALNSPSMQRYSALWKGGLDRPAREWLTEHGWQPTEHALGPIAESYGRPIRKETASGFVTAIRGAST
ncbi:SAM-dependent methyltransferase [Kutzneria kofuensis]|uniref:S-adenosyl-L-methionine-dependent methyltransferase n=1 Tax=Kutzneria kofuensis TaxID=103725 RepID=A0A7W9NHK5_9PSEU|nr:SAM-dependent methyltransferase [Kutzneria kofuensis]MBB5892326.1 methyltransferase (TIGR00027 family) [Kutzneria kofuensis]